MLMVMMHSTMVLSFLLHDLLNIQSVGLDVIVKVGNLRDTVRIVELAVDWLIVLQERLHVELHIDFMELIIMIN